MNSTMASNNSTNSPNPNAIPGVGNQAMATANLGRFPGQTPPWDPSFGAFPWSVASTSAAAAASAIEAAAYFASAGQNFTNGAYPGGEFGAYPWASQWPGIDSRYPMPKLPTPGANPLSTLGAHNMGLGLNHNRASIGRRRRNLFAPQQVIELQRAFTSNMYLKPEDREKLAQRTGLSINQNNRYKCKQKAKDEERAKRQKMKANNSTVSNTTSPSSNSNQNTSHGSNSGSSGGVQNSPVKSMKHEDEENDSDDKETPPNVGQPNAMGNISGLAESPPDLKLNHGYGQYNPAMYSNFFPFQAQGYTSTAALGPQNGYYGAPFC